VNYKHAASASDPSATAAHPAVQSLSPGARRAYFALLSRLDDYLGAYTKAEATMIVGRASASIAAWEELTAAGLLIGDGDEWMPITPRQCSDASAFPDPADTWSADALTVAAMADGDGVLGRLTPDEYGAGMDYVARERMRGAQ
jgi:hypothetical protein